MAIYVGVLLALITFSLLLIFSNFVLEKRINLKVLKTSSRTPGFGEYGDSHTNDPFWVREASFITYSQFLRLGMGPNTKLSSFDNRVKESKKVFKILAVGDSYTWGHGSNDQHARWAEELVRILEQKYHRNFSVTVLARPGAATITESEWLTKEYLAKVRPDLIILGLVFNDVIPNFEEKAVCPLGGCSKDTINVSYTYNKCRAHQYGAIGRMLGYLESKLPYLTQELTNLYCQPEKLSKVVQFPSEDTSYYKPKESPYYPFFTQGVQDIKAVTRVLPVLVAPLPVTNREVTYLTPLAGGFKEEGFKLVVMDNTISLLKKSKINNEFYANPDDPHPNMVMVDSWAQDMSHAISNDSRLVKLIENFPKIPQQGLNFNPQGGGVYYPLVSSALPAYIKVLEMDATKARLNLGEPNFSDGFANPNTNSPMQYAPCQAYKNPYSEILLNPNTNNIGIGVELTLSKISNYKVYIIGYNSKGEKKTQRIFNFTNKNRLKFNFTKSEESLGFDIVDLNGQGCSLNKEISFPSYQLGLSTI